MKTVQKAIQISPSRLNLFNECHRCFYLKEVKGIKRPDGPMASIPKGVDRDLKTYYDLYRGSLPPEIRGKVPGVLFGKSDEDFSKLQSWRLWQKRSFKYIDQDLDVTVAGAIDDCLVDGDVMIPLDYKTKSSTPKTDGSEYYQLQLDCYMLFLSQLGYKTDGRGFLVYYWPDSVKASADSEVIMSKNVNFSFGVRPFELKCSAERAKTTIKAAVECIRSERLPEPKEGCGFCSFGAVLAKLNGGV